MSCNIIYGFISYDIIYRWNIFKYICYEGNVGKQTSFIPAHVLLHSVCVLFAYGYTTRFVFMSPCCLSVYLCSRTHKQTQAAHKHKHTHTHRNARTHTVDALSKPNPAGLVVSGHKSSNAF